MKQQLETLYLKRSQKDCSLEFKLQAVSISEHRDIIQIILIQH